MKIEAQYFGIAEQILLSASNMVASLVVVTLAGVSWFGIYSFIFVFTTFAGAFLSTLLHRQMILLIASSDTVERRKMFLSTLAIQAVVILIVVSITFLLINLLAHVAIVEKFNREIIAAVLFISVQSFFDLCRQYLYVLEAQAYSFRCTLIYTVTLISGVIYLSILNEADSIVVQMYLLFSAALFVSLLANRRCQLEYLGAKWDGWWQAYRVLVGYLDQGRFRIVGMLVTWLQNQSMNPFLMWISGPLVAGMFSIARLMVMPMAVINQGLTNSTTPRLRRVYQSSGTGELQKTIAGYMRLNFTMAGIYIAGIGFLHFTGILKAWVPDYSGVQVFLLIWILTQLISMYRYWKSQYFTVSMQFRFLMNVSIIALIVSMSGMVGTGYFLNNVYAALLFVIVGELISILLFRHKIQSELAL